MPNTTWDKNKANRLDLLRKVLNKTAQKGSKTIYLSQLEEVCNQNMKNPAKLLLNDVLEVMHE